MSFLGDYIRNRRQQAGLNYAELANAIGYRNATKGMNRLVALEREGEGSTELIEKIITALGLDRREINRLNEMDLQAQQDKFDEWADAPVEPYLIRRVIPAVFIKHEIPDTIRGAGQRALEAYAIARAADWKQKVWLVLSRRRTIAISENGEVLGRHEATFEHHANSPFTRLRRRRLPVGFLNVDG